MSRNISPDAEDVQPPALGVGAHVDSQDGMCVMEAVSVAAGLPWSDRPACTNPTLALLAQLINDALTDSARPELVALVPALSRASGLDLATDWRVVDAACRFAATRRSRRSARTMSRWMSIATPLEGTPLRRPVTWLVRQGAARRAVEAAVASLVTTQRGDAERRSVEMLALVIAAVAPQGSTSPGQQLLDANAMGSS